MAINILEIVQQVSDSVKLETLLPSIKTYLAQVGNEQPDAKLKLQYLTIALNAFDASAAKDLNNEKSEAWSIMMKAWEQSYTLECEPVYLISFVHPCPKYVTSETYSLHRP